VPRRNSGTAMRRGRTCGTCDTVICHVPGRSSRADARRVGTPKTARGSRIRTGGLFVSRARLPGVPGSGPPGGEECWCARRSHEPIQAGSIPAPATQCPRLRGAEDSTPGCGLGDRRFESCRRHRAWLPGARPWRPWCSGLHTRLWPWKDSVRSRSVARRSTVRTLAGGEPAFRPRAEDSGGPRFTAGTVTRMSHF
jgi:hypothetical protein